MHDRLVTIATFHESVPAFMAKNYLVNQGIPSILLDETTIATDWLLAGAIGGIKLQVAAVHVERAELLLAQIKETAEDAEPEDLALQSAIATQEIAEDLKSEREDREKINQLTDKAFRAAVIGLLFWPIFFYALYLLSEIAMAEGTISSNRLWKLWVATPLALLGALALPITCWILPVL